MHASLCRASVLAVALAACGAPRQAPPGPPPTTSVPDDRIAIEIEPPVAGATLWFWDTVHGELAREVSPVGPRALVERASIAWADRLVVTAPGYAAAVVDLPPGTDSLTVHLPTATTTTGRILVDGVPQGGRVSLRPFADDRPRDPELGWLVDMVAGADAVAADDGRFELHGLAAGARFWVRMDGLRPRAGSPPGVEAGTDAGDLAFAAPRSVVRGVLRPAGPAVPEERPRVFRVRCILRWDDDNPEGHGALQIPVEPVACGVPFAIDLGDHDPDELSLEVLAPGTDRHRPLAGPIELDPQQVPIDVGPIAVGADDRAVRVTLTCDDGPVAGAGIRTDGTTTYTTDSRGEAWVRVGNGSGHATIAGAGIAALHLPVPEGTQTWPVRARPATRAVLMLVGRDGEPLTGPAAAHAVVTVRGEIPQGTPFSALPFVLPRTDPPGRRSYGSDRKFALRCRVPPTGVVEVTDIRGTATVSLQIDDPAGGQARTVDEQTVTFDETTAARPLLLRRTGGSR